MAGGGKVPLPGNGGDDAAATNGRVAPAGKCCTSCSFFYLFSRVRVRVREKNIEKSPLFSFRAI